MKQVIISAVLTSVFVVMGCGGRTDEENETSTLIGVAGASSVDETGGDVSTGGSEPIFVQATGGSESVGGSSSVTVATTTAASVFVETIPSTAGDRTIIAGQELPNGYKSFRITNEGDQDLPVQRIAFRRQQSTDKMSIVSFFLGDTNSFGAIGPTTTTEEEFSFDVEHAWKNWMTVPAHGTFDFPTTFFPAKQVYGPGDDANLPRVGDRLTLKISKLVVGGIEAELRTQETPQLTLDSKAAYGTFSFCGGPVSEGCCTTGSFAHDYEKPLSSMLIKRVGSPSVFYLGSDGKKYIFPSRTELASWYDWNASAPTENPDVCKTVREFPDDVVLALPTGHSVTVRPGTYIIGISTDPKMFAVSRYGTLRFLSYRFPSDPTNCPAVIPSVGPMPCWSMKESVNGIAFQYFSNADDRMRVVRDEFYLTYLVGQAITDPMTGLPITDAEPYDPQLEYDWGAPTMFERELGIIP